MDAAAVVRSVRSRAGMSLRELAKRAGTSHSTLAAYEAGRKVPTVDTLERVVRASGHEFTMDGRLVTFSGPERETELLEVLELAAMFPASPSRTLDAPVFGK
jgi:transcriptional regulator with XRE-family HTH domain